MREGEERRNKGEREERYWKEGREGEREREREEETKLM